jgi:hypothetical protein
MIETGALDAALRLEANHPLQTLRQRALIIGVIALALSAVGIWIDAPQFFQSYLIAFLFWCGIPLGSMAILMLQYITGGTWGAAIRRVLESSMRTLPLIALLFLPLLLGLHHLYEWTHAEAVAHDPVLRQKTFYLNEAFFIGRAVFYFFVWLVVAWFLDRWSMEQDERPSYSVGKRLHYLSRGGLLLYSLTMTFAAIDWIMSLEPHWYSTIYGILVIGGQVLTAMSFTIPIVVLLAENSPRSRVLSADILQDLGKLLLGFIMLWAYFAFSQYLIIWSGNLPEETPWYLSRLRGGWEWMGVALIVFHFALPFAVLLSRDLKRSGRLLMAIAMGVLVARFLEIYWMVTPAFSPAQLTFHWMDLTAVIGVGGVWLATFVWCLQARPLLPRNDPALLPAEEA